MIKIIEIAIDEEQPPAILTFGPTERATALSVYEYGNGESTIYLSREQLYELLSGLEEYLLETSDV